jgi:uncharacterized glyoxalase superfamily protein PhnB
MDFFVVKLGFNNDFVYGDPPFYAQVSRDNVLLAIRFTEAAPIAQDIRNREVLLSASITLGSAGEIEELYQDYQAKDVPMYQTLRDEPWGAKTFIINDPDGNLVLFAAPGT